MIGHTLRTESVGHFLNTVAFLSWIKQSNGVFDMAGCEANRNQSYKGKKNEKDHPFQQSQKITGQSTEPGYCQQIIVEHLQERKSSEP